MSRAEPSSYCWAHTLGGCTRPSGEHRVSRSYFPEGVRTVRVEDADGSRQVGVRHGLKRKRLLCEHHNTTSHPLDDAGASLRKGICTLFGSQEWDLETPINGWLLERWFAKEAVNQIVDKRGYQPAPPAWLCQQIFGQEAFGGDVGGDVPEGLMLGTRLAKPHSGDDTPGTDPSRKDPVYVIDLIEDDQGSYAGALHNVVRVEFATIWRLEPGSRCQPRLSSFSSTEFIYHPPEIAATHTTGLRRSLKISWNYDSWRRSKATYHWRKAQLNRSSLVTWPRRTG